jgi:hypothetical protein
MAVNVEKDEGDALTVLCGDSVPGSIKYNYTLAGTVLQDLITAGLSAYTWTNAGKAVVFEFVPQTGATAHKVAGNVVIDPMAIGTSDGEFGDVMTADVEWSIVGTPTVTWASAIPAGMSVEENAESDHLAAADDDREPADA